MDTSYLTTQVSTIIGQLHGIFDDIGVPNHERESREAEVSFGHGPHRWRWILMCMIAVRRSFGDPQ